MPRIFDNIDNALLPELSKVLAVALLSFCVRGMDPPMPNQNHRRRPSELKEAWPILAVGVGIVGLLAWISWEVTRPEETGAERR